MKKLIIFLIVLGGIGYFLKVPTETVTNGSFLKGEVAAIQHAISSSFNSKANGPLECETLLVNATGVTSVDTSNLTDASDWIAGCQYIQGLVA